jgi:hypothetical protein
MIWSFSRTNSFHNCAYSWYLSYIECADKESNFFAEYGLLVHATLEKYFKNELEVYELAQWYQDNYSEFVKTPCPPFPVGMENTYINNGLEFFENFDFPKDEYEILGVEDDFVIDLFGIPTIIKPDLYLRHKVTQKTVLIDYKSSILFKPTNSEKNSVMLWCGDEQYRHTFKAADKKEKLLEYVRQMYLYCYGIQKHHGIQIDEIRLWFIRQGMELRFPFKPEKCDEALGWYKEEISKIKLEEDFKPITDGLSDKELKQVAYFCGQLCNFRSWCPYRANIGEQK